jgi:probable HAF family extracellular repeat protein
LSANVAAANANGSVMVGWSGDSQGHEHAFRWAAGAGFDPFGPADSHANGASGDGSSVVGDRAITGGHISFRWTVGTRTFQDLESLSGYAYCYANGVSSNGLVTVGYCNDNPSNQHLVAVRWEGTTVFELGFPQTDPFTNWAIAANSDGSTILARTGSGEGWLWDAVNGVRSLISILTAANGDVTTLASTHVQAMSSDGKTVVGSSSFGGAFIARLP